ncbi:MAG: hypothetical protein H0U95_10595 [Bacteroidetes bacterium]|nr:hypothetical protein [Bacteroidota bacterium]
MTEKIKLGLTVLIPYGLICACSWYISYWSTFDINPFDYLGINDLIKGFIYPFAISALASIFVNIISTHSLIGAYNPETRTPSGLLANPKVQEWGKVIYVLLILVLTIFVDSETKWMVLPNLYSLGIVLYLLNNDKIKEYFPRYALRFMIISLCIAIPTASITFAKSNSLNVKHNLKYQYTFQKDISGDTLKVIGKLGDYIFLSTIDNKIKYAKSLDKMTYFEIFEKK